MLTALAAFGALYFTSQSLGATRDQLALSEQGQIADRFTKAVGQLGDKDSVDVRLGGIYALERIARDSPRDHSTVMEVLSAFVREHAPVATCVTPKPGFGPPTDVQAVLTVLHRRDGSRDPDPLNLAESCLSGAALAGGQLAKTIFLQSDLSHANLVGVDFTGAHFGGAKLASATFFDGNLSNAILIGADLSGADLELVELANANLGAANLTNARLGNSSYAFGADLTDANFAYANLTGADLSGANLHNANLAMANLTGATLDGANLSGANLEGATLVGVKGTPKNIIWPPR